MKPLEVYGLELLPDHAKLLADSAITPEVARTRGYKSVTNKRDLRELGFGELQRRVPCLLIPVWDVHGRLATHQIRPDKPRVDKKTGKPRKYETPAGSRMVLDVPRGARAWLDDPKLPLFITEGARKADAAVSQGLACVALLGVWNFRGTNEHGGKVALADFDSVALNDRDVYVAFDSDVTQKPAVQEALLRLRSLLERRDARVRVINLPPGPGGTKTGLDDFFARGGSVQQLFALATTALPQAVGTMYGRHDGRLLQRQVTNHGVIHVPLTNFDARIVGDIVEDDGAETRRFYELDVTLNGRRTSLRVSVTEFHAMTWPGEHLGAGAIVFAGPGRHAHVPVAIQLLSDAPIPERHVYAHTGWRQLTELTGHPWAYLHAGGAIGATGAIPGVDVALPEALSRYRLLLPPTDEQLILAIRASLRLLDVAPAHISIPLYAAIWRAVLGGSDFSIHLTGDTGAGKTALLVVVLQHFGAEWSEGMLPNWSSTGNSLEALAFQAKDAVLAVDDFSPSIDPNEARRQQRDADRLFRAQGNVSGRQRMRADTTLRPQRPPRGVIASTGEDVPRGQSLRARLAILQVEKGTDGKGDVDWAELTRCQQDAGRGLYAMTTAAFIRWLAPRYEEVRRSLRATLQQRRAAADLPGAHRRTPGIVADLAVGLEYFLAFAREAGAITEGDAAALTTSAQAAFAALALAQQAEQIAGDPVRRFLELVAAAIAGGLAHLAGPGGDPPAKETNAYGWRAFFVGAGDEVRTEWRPQGQRIGWVSGEGHEYLEPDVSYAVAQQLARDQGETLAVAPKTLHKRLRERKLLVETDPERSTVRRLLEGKRRHVLWVRAVSLLPESGQSGQSGPAGERP